MMGSRFMPADALWTLCMAFNVYLTFFHQYNSSQLRKLEWKYFLLCYGVPFISAFVFLFVDSHDRGPLYGPAVVRPLCSNQYYHFSLGLTLHHERKSSSGVGSRSPGTHSPSSSFTGPSGLSSCSPLPSTSVPASRSSSSATRCGGCMMISSLTSPQTIPIRNAPRA